VQRAEGKADDALRTLDAAPAAGFEAAFEEVRGDIAADRGDRTAALRHYTAAAAGIADGLVNREALELKVTALGGTLPEPAPAAGVRP
jgi:predicted negative regulator of RcsB-dependent stress response